MCRLVRSDALRWTAHMEDCLRALERDPEFPLDAILVQQVKISRIVEKANLSLVSTACKSKQVPD